MLRATLIHNKTLMFQTNLRLLYHTISGKKVAESVREQIKQNIINLKKENPTFVPNLRIIQVGNRPDSSTYVRSKEKAAKECFMNSTTDHLPNDITEEALIGRIKEINSDPSIHGLMIQLPLPAHLNEQKITDAIDPTKDVDGLTTYNVGQLTKKNGNPYFLPCTPHGIIKLLKSENIQIKGKLAVVLGRSDIVGVPIATLL